MLLVSLVAHFVIRLETLIVVSTNQEEARQRWWGNKIRPQVWQHAAEGGKQGEIPTHLWTQFARLDRSRLMRRCLGRAGDGARPRTRSGIISAITSPVSVGEAITNVMHYICRQGLYFPISLGELIARWMLVLRLCCCVSRDYFQSVVNIMNHCYYTASHSGSIAAGQRVWVGSWLGVLKAKVKSRQSVSQWARQQL